MSTQRTRELLLRLDADMEAMRRELIRAADVVDEQARRIQNAGDRAGGGLDDLNAAGGRAAAGMNFLKGAAGGFIASLSVDAVLGAGRAVLEYADNLSTAADQAGISVERFQTLREALRSLEVDADQQDKIFQKLLTTMGAVQGGTAGKGVVEVLDRMGLTARILNGEIDSTDELLDGIAKAATSYTTQAKFAADVSALVGQKAGPALAAALADGGAALKTAEDQFTATGQVIKKEMIDRLADANEKWDVFLRDTRNNTVIWAAGMLELFEKAGRGYDRFFGKVDDSSRGGLIDANMRLQNEIRELQTGKGNFGIVPVGIINGKKLELAEVQRKLAAMPPDRAPTAAPKTTPTPTPTPTPKPTARAKPAAPVDLVRETFLGGALPLDRKIANIAGLPEANVRMDELLATMSEIAALPPINPVDEEGLLLLNRAMADLSDGLAGALVFGDDIGDVLVNSAKRFAAELASKAIFGGLEKLLGGGSGGGIGGILAGLFGGRRSSGGPVEPGVPYLVGENSPEIFIPTSRGRISPNVGSGGGGQPAAVQSVTVTVQPSPLFVTTVVQGAQAAAADTMRRAGRPRMPAAAGA